MVQIGPRPLVVCGPSGSGKSSLINKLFEEYPNKFGFSVSHTTRKPRPGEENGTHYHFTDRDTMERAIQNGEFIETATFSGNIYGTSKKAVEKVQLEGKVCVLDIEVEGVKQINQTSLNPIKIFIKPPSISELEKRLRQRNTETEDTLKARLARAKKELEYGETPGNFHYVIVNNNLDEAYKQFKKFIFTEINDDIEV